MRLPVKLNRRGWPSFFGRLPFAREDPRRIAAPEALTSLDFSRSLSVLKFGSTFKTTSPARHLDTNQAIKRLVVDMPIIVLDIGASDGSTSLDLIAELGQSISAYYVTDFNVEAYYGTDPGGAAFFRDAEQRCVLRATNHFLVYSDVQGAPAPLAWLARRLLQGEQDVTMWKRVPLVQREVLTLAESDPRISVCKYDMFKPWQGQRPTITKIANVLNRSYFSDEQIRRVLRVQVDALVDGGYLVVTDNRGSTERTTIYRKARDKLGKAFASGGGTEIASLVGDEWPEVAA